MTPDPSAFTFQVPPEAAGTRIDRYLAALLEPQGLSRARVQSLIDAGDVFANGATVKAATRLKGGETLTIRVPPPKPSEVLPEDIPLTVLYEDSSLVVIDKPPGMAVHPARGAETGTLVHALLYQIDDLSGIGGEERPGIVHRLDKDTSGVLVVAKTDLAHQGLAAQFKVHSISRHYRAIVRGNAPHLTGTFTSSIGRNPHNRLKMTSLKKGGRHAVTHYKTLETLPGTSLLELTLETGRTHQIRVHCSEAGCPVLNDDVYGGHWRRGLPDDERLNRALAQSGRQLLHARHLGFCHPEDGRYLEFTAEPPEDFLRVLQVLRELRDEEKEGGYPDR